MPNHDFHVFLSHSSKNKSDVIALAKDLEHENFKVWISYDEIEIGKTFPDDLQDGLNRSAVLVVYWTKEASESKWVQKEIVETTNQNKDIIALRLDDTPLGITLANQHGIDFRPSHHRGMGQLISHLNKLFAEEVVPPPDQNAAWQPIERPSRRSQFLENNQYLDPNSIGFAQNDWTSRIAQTNNAPLRFLSLVAVPVPDPLQSISLRETGLPFAKNEPPFSMGESNSSEPAYLFSFIQLDRLQTTRADLLRFQYDRNQGQNTTQFNLRQFLRITENGAIEFVPPRPYLTVADHPNHPILSLTFILGSAWKFIHLATNIYTHLAYKINFQLLVNLKYVTGSLLGGFAGNVDSSKPRWIDPMNYREWRFNHFEFPPPDKISPDLNMQFGYQVNVEQLRLSPGLSRDFMEHLSRRIQNSFNWEYTQRHYLLDTKIFDWKYYEYFSQNVP